MPRPFKAGFEYFPLDTDFFGNKKIKNLRRAHGSIGVLTYLNLLCRVYKNGYYYKFDDLEELAIDIAEEIASEQLRRTATGVTETINYLVRRGTLDEGLFERGIISGVALQEQYVISAYKAKRNIKMDVHCLVDVLQVIEKNRVNSELTNDNYEETEDNAEFGTQSKINKSKVNKTIYNTTTNACAKPPFGFEILAYFESKAVKNADKESLLFQNYNDDHGWDCLPDWKAAADRWILRIKK